MTAPVIQFKRGLFSNLPGLRAGEPGFTTDKYDLYVGIDSTTNGNKFFGSHRYWTKETTSAGSGLNLVEGTENGDNTITLKAPASIPANYTITFPSAIVTDGYLKVASDGTLSWAPNLTSSTLSISGISTLGQALATTVSATGIITASSFSGSGSGLTAGTVPVSALDIDGATAATGLTSDDLFIIDDGAGGTNKKLTAQQLSDYVLGGSGGATFPAITVTGIATINTLKATTSTTTGIATASSFRGSDFRDTDGSLVPLVGVSSASAHTGLVTAFKFTGTGLEEYTVANEIATIKISGVAASTYTTNEVFTATQGQTSFNFTAGYEDGFVDVYLNGIRLISGTDFTANNGADVVLASGATAGDELEVVSFKELGDVFSLNNLRLAGGLRVTGVVTATSFNGALNQTAGVSTVGQLSAVTVNASGIVTASSFSGSGSGLSAGTVPASAIDIDGATAATALTSDDLFLIDDGAGGTNKKLTAQQLSNYVLGGSGGATFPAINVTGLGTVSQLQATTATVGAGLTVSGATDLNGGLDVSGSATIDQLRVSGVTTSTGGFVGALTGNSSTATALQTARNFQVTGDAASASVSFDGTANVGLAVTLATVNSNVGTFGSQTQIPVVTVNAKGLVTAVSTASVGTALTVTGDSGSENINLLSEALTISGGTNLTSSAASNTVTINLDPNISLTSVVASGVVTATGGFSGNVTGNLTGNVTGNLNSTGVSTASFLQATTVNASGIVTASSFSGSGSGLSAGTVPVSALDIDGATAATALTSDDLFIIDDGAGGTNKKLTAQQLSNYVLGGSGGATFPAINVTGLGTVSQLQVTTATVGAGLTVTGATDLNGGLDVSGGETVLSSATVSDLTSGRVVLAGTSGALEDSANLTFGANGLRVTGTANYTGIVTASSFSGPLTGNVTGNLTGEVNASSINVSGLSTFVGNAVFQGHASFGDQDEIRLGASDDLKIVHTASGAPFDRNRIISNVTSSSIIGLAVETAGGSIVFSKNDVIFGSGENLARFIPDGAVELYHDSSKKFETTGYGATVFGTLQSQQINVSGVTTSTGGFSGNLTGNVTGNLNSTGVSTASFLQATTVNVSAAATIPTLSGTTATFTNITANGGFTGNINTSGIGTIATLKATTATVGAGLTVSGATDLNGGLDVSGGETVLSSATVSDLTAGRVVLAGTSGSLEDNSNLTFSSGAGLRVTGGANVSAASTFGGNLNVGGNVVVTGDLTVNGTTTQINTVTMTVEDTLLELQVIDGSAPASDTNKDVGIVMNYFTSSAKKAAFYWDDSVSRMVAASDVSESSGVLTASTFAGLEIGSLFLNDCAGASQVISCSGTTRSLENITIDGGLF
jgi:hypothetical protein